MQFNTIMYFFQPLKNEYFPKVLTEQKATTKGKTGQKNNRSLMFDGGTIKTTKTQMAERESHQKKKSQVPPERDRI